MKEFTYAFISGLLILGAWGNPGHRLFLVDSNVEAKEDSLAFGAQFHNEPDFSYPLVEDELVCGIYQASNTNFGKRNYESCLFSACSGQTLMIESCDYCLGEVYGLLWANNLSQTESLVEDGNGCGNSCPKFTYRIPGNESDGVCYRFDLRQACGNQFDTCQGQFIVTTMEGSSGGDDPTISGVADNTVIICASLGSVAFFFIAAGVTITVMYRQNRKKLYPKIAPIDSKKLPPPSPATVESNFSQSADYVAALSQKSRDSIFV
jgi:hypothetical protein